MDYQGNTRKDKEPKEPKKVEKVVVSEVIQKPPSISFKFKNIFMGENFRTTSRFLVADVVYPTLQGLIFDIVVEGAKNTIFPGGRRYYNKRPGSWDRDYQRQSHISYDNPLRPGTFRDEREYRDPRPRAILPDQASRTRRPDPGEIIIASREEAEAIIERMIDIIDNYDSVSLADYYDMLGLPTSPINNTWGWLVLTSAKVRQVRDGYVIDLPRMEVL